MLLHDIDNAQRQRRQMSEIGHQRPFATSAGPGCVAEMPLGPALEVAEAGVRVTLCCEPGPMFRTIDEGMTRLTWTGLCPSSG